MSRFFGEVRQLGYVVPDIEAGMRYWSDVLGVGPWFYAPRVPVEKFTQRGQPSLPETSVALANSGPLQIELIQPRNDAPSMYQEFIRAGHSGLHHVAYWTETYDADLIRLKARGLEPCMAGEVGANGRFCYFDTGIHPGAVVELSEVVGPKGKLFSLIREASLGWGGEDPVRPFPDLSRL
jgi:hypothetical protein